MSLKLPPRLAAILREVVRSRKPDLLRAVESSGPLSADARQALRAVLADELVASGLQEDDEPNARGRDLEDLIDKLGHL